jgi:Protein of unknown function (DUF2523)
VPIFLAALLGGLVSAAGSFVGRVLIALGVGVVAYAGIDVALGEFKTLFVTSVNGLDSRIVGMMGVMHIGAGVNILLSALLVRMTLNGLTSGTIKRMVLK